MFNEPTFLELAMKGQVRPEAIDDYIDDWHASLEATCDLHDYLGMTADEYARWVEDSTTLANIIAKRRSHDAEPNRRMTI